MLSKTIQLSLYAKYLAQNVNIWVKIGDFVYYIRSTTDGKVDGELRQEGPPDGAGDQPLIPNNVWHL